jgi:hypothetical protein
VATSLSTGETYVVVGDKAYFQGVNEVSVDLPNGAYIMELLAWRPTNLNSNTIVFSYPPENLTLEDMSIGTTEVYVATNSITAGPNFTVESTGDVTFQAGNIITLKPDFTAVSDSRFHAYIDEELGGGGLGKRIATAPEVEAMIAQATDVKTSELIPTIYSLSPAYPNPFNPSTMIRFGLPGPSRAVLLVYDILGREITRLVDGNLEAAYHTVMWQGRDASGMEVPSGVYIARLITPKYAKSIKMLLLK